MKNVFITGVLILGFIACSKPKDSIRWAFHTPERDLTNIEDLLGDYYLLSPEMGILIYNGFTLAVEDTTTNTFRYVYKNRWYNHLEHILAVEIITNKAYRITQVGIYVKAETKYYQSWKKYMLRSGYETSDIYTEMNGDIDEFFNDSVHALLLMTVNPYLILYSDNRSVIDEL